MEALTKQVEALKASAAQSASGKGAEVAERARAAEELATTRDNLVSAEVISENARSEGAAAVARAQDAERLSGLHSSIFFIPRLFELQICDTLGIQVSSAAEHMSCISDFQKDSAFFLSKAGISDVMNVSLFDFFSLYLDKILDDLKGLSTSVSEMMGRSAAHYAALQQSYSQLKAELKASQESEEAAYEKLKQLRDSARLKGAKTTNHPGKGTGLDKESCKVEVPHSGAALSANPSAGPSTDEIEASKQEIIKLQKKVANIVEKEKKLTDELNMVKELHAVDKQALIKLQQELSAAQSSIDTLRAREMQLNSEVAVLNGKLQGLKDENASLEGRLAAEKIKSERNRDAAATVCA